MNNVITPDVYQAAEQWSLLYREARPYPHIVIDNFLVHDLAEKLLRDFPAIAEMYPSRVYLFGNKHELSSMATVSPRYARLYDEFLSDRFRNFISAIGGEALFVDPDFYACGLNQNGDGGFQDMHTDLNSHPHHETWLHRLNVLLYLNKDWQPEYGGGLRLRHGRTGPVTEISPLFNRCVIVRSDDTSYHGYNPVTLPAGTTRKAVVAFCYKETPLSEMPARKMIDWDPENASLLKRVTARLFNPAVLLKNRLVGSKTSRHR